MSMNGDAGERIAALIGALEKAAGEVELMEGMEPLSQLVYSFCRYGVTEPEADAAYDGLLDGMVDLNELRVSDTAEIAAVLGKGYGDASDRAARLKDALNGVYASEHGMTLERLTKIGKREAKAYLEGLDGVLPYVSASVMVLSLGAHAVAVDDRLLGRLIEDGVLDEGTDVPGAQSVLERNIKADDSLRAHTLLTQFAEGVLSVSLGGLIPKKRKKVAKKVTEKKVTKKKVAKKKTSKKTTKSKG